MLEATAEIGGYEDPSLWMLSQAVQWVCMQRDRQQVGRIQPSQKG